MIPHTIHSYTIMDAAILMVMMMMMMGCVAVASVLGLILYNRSSVDGSSSSEDTGDTTTSSEGENCAVKARTECDGKSGDERTKCTTESKKKCMAISGNYWDVSKANDARNEDSKYITASWSGNQILVPSEARSHTSEDCVYFYDYSKPWTDSDGAVRASGKWCVADGKLGEDIPIWDVKDKSGDLNHKSVDYLRIGKNVKVTVWDNHSNDPFKGTGNSKMYLGSDFGNKKLIQAKDGVGENDIDAFKIEKI